MKRLLSIVMTLVVYAAALATPAYAAAPSLNNADVLAENKAEPEAKHSVDYGYKLGGGKCVFDPSAVSGDRTIAAHECGLVVPKNAIVTFAAYRVVTTFTSATDAATIAIHIVSANDVVTATAISGGSNIWDAGTFETVPKIETSTTWLLTTAPSPVTFTVATEALTAGKLVLWVQWLYFNDV